MLFEVHLTVSARLGLAEACAALLLKPTDLELDHGAHPAQPMASFHVHASLDGAVARAAVVAADLAARGLNVVRTKIEAPLEPGHVALEGLYCEHHVRVVDGDAVAGVCAAHGAHLARVARGRERYATLRDTVPDTARARAAEFVGALKAAGVEVTRVVAEVVVVDTARALDHGWEHT